MTNFLSDAVPTDVDSILSRRFDGWTQNLLDLSKRNRLLYFKPQANTTVKIVEPDLSEIWKRLVKRSKPLSFYGLEAEADLFDDDEEEGDSDIVPQRPLRADELRTDPTSTRLGKTLLYLRHRARTSLEEQGIVTLFVTFGFLRWNEAAKDGSAGEDIFSPLLLLPVTLQRESVRKPYTLRLWEDEVVLNPALKFRLAQEAKILLPEPGDAEDFDLMSYFAQVEDLIRKQPTWALQEISYLGLFSFHKISMYRDLYDNRERALSHSLVRALAGDSKTVPDVPADLLQGVALDAIAPHAAWQVVDADSSQQEAIAAARRGVSFVLQGPPGTGKSQTITNIIAECLAAGKKVLFVSEKMAALQVVHGRLAQSGLRDFCLEVHSHKANKREVVKELERTLRVARPTLMPLPDEASQLADLRDGLNNYARELHLRREPSNLSFWEAVSHFSRWHDAPQLPFSFDNPTTIAPPQRTQIDACLREMARLYRVLETHETHPWRGVALHESDLQTRDEIRIRFSRLASSLRALDVSLRTSAQLLGLTRFPSLNVAHRVLELAELLEKTPHPPREWLEESDLPSRQNRVHEWQPRFDNFNARRDALTQHCGSSFLDLSHDDLRERLTTRHENVLRRLVPANGADVQGSSPGENALRVRNELLATLSQTLALLDELQALQSTMNATLQTSSASTLTGALWLHTLATLVAHDPRPRAHWFEPEKIASLEQSAHLAQSNENAIEAARKSLSAYHIDQFLACDLDALIARFEGSYQQAENVVVNELQPELRRLATFADGAPKTFQRAVADLEVAETAWQQMQWLDNNADELKGFPNYNNFKTDWTQARELATTAAQEAREHQAGFVTAREKLSSYNLEALLALDHRALMDAISKDAASFWRFAKPAFQHAVKSVQAARLSSSTSTFVEMLSDLETAQLAAQHDKWLKSQSSTHSSLFGARFQGLDTNWQDVINHIEATTDEAQAHAKIYHNIVEKLPDYNVAALLREDIPAWRTRLIEKYGAAVRSVEEEMPRDVATLQKLRAVTEARSRNAWLHDLEIALELRERMRWRDAQSAAYTESFGAHYHGAQTDWHKVLEALQTCRALIAHHPTLFEPLQKVLCGSGAPIARIETQNKQFKALLFGLQNATKTLHEMFPLHSFPFGEASLTRAALPDLRAFLADARASFLDFFAAYDQAGGNGARLQISLDDLVEGAKIVQEQKVLESWDDEGRALFESFFRGTQTAWPQVVEALAWSQRVLDWSGTNALPEPTLDVATDEQHGTDLQTTAAELRARLRAVNDDWAWAQTLFPTWQVGGRPAEHALLTDAANWLEERVARLDELEEWLSWQRLQESSTRLGLASFWEVALREKPAAPQIEGAFWRRFWALWLDQMQHFSPQLKFFAGEVHDANIQRFRVLDVAFLQAVRVRLAAMLAQDRPRPEAARAGQVAILQKEAVKKSKHKPLRALFGEVSLILQALKPCMLMSPLSVAQFLQPDKVRFDLVIFDEASQICSEDAVGAIMRGSQLIVVGDRKQLPPSRFFGGNSFDEDEEESEEGGEVYESILDECATMGLPDRMLRWHYRSRNEALIAFSN